MIVAFSRLKWYKTQRWFSSHLWSRLSRERWCLKSYPYQFQKAENADSALRNPTWLSLLSVSKKTAQVILLRVVLWCQQNTAVSTWVFCSFPSWAIVNRCEWPHWSAHESENNASTVLVQTTLPCIQYFLAWWGDPDPLILGNMGLFLHFITFKNAVNGVIYMAIPFGLWEKIP